MGRAATSHLVTFLSDKTPNTPTGLLPDLSEKVITEAGCVDTARLRVFSWSPLLSDRRDSPPPHPNLQLVQVFDPPEIELLPSTASYVILSPPAGLDPVADKTRQKCSELSVFISEIPWREFKPRRPNVWYPRNQNNACNLG